MTTEEMVRTIDNFQKISGAKSPKESAAFAALIQEGSTRELIKGVNDLLGSVNNLADSSRRLEKATYALVFLTCILAWFTWKLVGG